MITTPEGVNYSPKGLIYFLIFHDTVQHQYFKSLAVRGKSISLFVLIGTFLISNKVM